MRGRVMALYLMCFMGGTPLGAPIIGWVAGVAGPRWGLVGGGLVCLLAALAIALLLGHRRGLTARSVRRPAPRRPRCAHADVGIPSGSWPRDRQSPARMVGMRIERVSDPADPRLDDFRDLTDADVRPDRRGIVIAEGVNVVAAAGRLALPDARGRRGAGPARGAARRPSTARRARCTWSTSGCCPRWSASGSPAACWPSADRPRLAGRGRAAGRRAAARGPRGGSTTSRTSGALFRNAAAFGVDAVLLDPHCADPLYRRSVRVSMGHVLQVPFAVLAGPWPRRSTPSARRRLHAARADPARGRVDAARASCRRRAGRCCSAPRARAHRRRRWPPPTGGCASRWHPASTRSTWPPPPRSPSPT